MRAQRIPRIYDYRPFRTCSAFVSRSSPRSAEHGLVIRGRRDGTKVFARTRGMCSWRSTELETSVGSQFEYVYIYLLHRQFYLRPLPTLLLLTARLYSVISYSDACAQKACVDNSCAPSCASFLSFIFPLLHGSLIFVPKS